MRSNQMKTAVFCALVATFTLVSELGLADAQTKPGPQTGSTVYLPHLYRPEATDCMDRSVFVGINLRGASILTEYDHHFFDQKASVISERVAQIMTSRAERVVYVSGDRAVTYGSVAGLIAALQGSTKDLNVVLVSQKDMNGIQSGLCLAFR